MDAFIDNNPELYTLWCLYLGLVIVKTVLCYASLDVAVVQLRKQSPSIPVMAILLAMVFAIPVILFFLALPTLAYERHRFFLPYRDDVIKEEIESGAK